MLEISGEFSIDSFIETGTAYGDTAEWAGSHFDEVKTIELSTEIYQKVSDAHQGRENIDFIQGKSQEKLPRILNSLDSPAIFWLDAHYSGGEYAGEDQQCPLIEELKAFRESDEQHFVFIDDARYFCAPPPAGYSPGDWPSISEVITTVHQEFSGDYGVLIIGDVILAYPRSAEDFIVDRVRNQREFGQVGVLPRVGGGSRLTETKEGLNQALQGFSLIARGILDILATPSTTKLLRWAGVLPFAKRLYRRLGP